ncbi:ATP-binding protein [Streptacidiphilus neutrinimicus]|uniref:ATP-binding protein n=1 Tax=Streptacidiphilus neutrinimicus TaxID=105420 RepID=UPI0006936438|nr:ATP-binding protein [Streptacidiphilus neutrinimicus]
MIAAFTTYGTGPLTAVPATPEHGALVATEATPSAVPRLRGIVRRVAANWGLPDDAVAALMLASSELVTNVVVHSGSPDVELLLTATHEHAELRIRDHGRWHDPEQRGALPTGGRGLDLVRAQADLQLIPSQNGTAATARIPLTPARHRNSLTGPAGSASAGERP